MLITHEVVADPYLFLSQLSPILALSFFNYISDKKETHHLELFNSQEDHKGYASLVYISSKVCQVLLRYTSFAIGRRNCVKENCSWTKWGSNCKITGNKRFY